MVEVTTDDTPAPAGWPMAMPWPFGKGQAQISWNPPPTLPSAQLIIRYVGATLLDMGNTPSGGYIRFRIPTSSGPDDTRVILSLPDGGTIIFQRDELRYGFDYGSDDETRPIMDIVFAYNDTNWRRIRPAITAGGRLGVRLVRHGDTIVEAVFDFSDRAARDALLAQARRKVTAADPSVCTTAPQPVKILN